MQSRYRRDTVESRFAKLMTHHVCQSIIDIRKLRRSFSRAAEHFRRDIESYYSLRACRQLPRKLPRSAADFQSRFTPLRQMLQQILMIKTVVVPIAAGKQSNSIEICPDKFQRSRHLKTDFFIHTRFKPGVRSYSQASLNRFNGFPVKYLENENR